MKAPQKTNLPLFGLRKDAVTTHDLVFQILSRDYPKSIAAIRETLRTGYNQKLSYQAVRKSVLALSNIGALTHSRSGYLISTHWLLRVRGVIDSVLDYYRGVEGAVFDPGAEYQTFSAHSLYETDILWGDILLDICAARRTQKEKSFVSINKHPWWLPMNLGREAALFKKLLAKHFSVQFLFTVKTKSTLEACNFYKNIGVSVGVVPRAKIPANQYYNIIGDIVIEVTLPQHLADAIEREFKHPRAPTTESVHRLAHRAADIRITIQRNATLARALSDLCLPFSQRH